MENKSKWQEFVRSYSVWDRENVKGFFGYKDNEYGWLSNFWKCDVLFEGDLYASSEHAYMAAKTIDREARKPFMKGDVTLSPADAKKLGQTLQLRDNWDEVKYDFMLAIVFDKFWRNKDLRERLLATGNKYLEERNHWRDLCWGVDYKTNEGLNYLGQVLMRVRDCLKRY